MRILRAMGERYGPFDEFDVSFPRKTGEVDIHIFTGPNGTGKSSLLHALFAPFTSSRYVAERLWRRDSWVAVEFDCPVDESSGKQQTTWIALIPNAPQLDVGFKGKIPEQGGRLHHWGPIANDLRLYGPGDAKNALREHITNAGKYNYSKPDHYQLEFGVFAYAGGRSLGQAAGIKTISEQTNNPSTGAAQLGSTATSSEIAQWVANCKSKEALAKNYARDAEAERYALGVQTLEKLVSELIGEEVTFDMDLDPISVRVVFGGERLSFDLLPDGVKSVLSWAGDLVFRLDRIRWVSDGEHLKRPLLLALDEAEVHLHPKWQQKILPTLARVLPDAQIFVSTHSPFVVSSSADATIHPLRLDGRRAVLGTPMPAASGKSYSAVLREIMEVPWRFDPESERLLEDLRAARDSVLRGDEGRTDRFDDIAASLTKRSQELAQLVQLEVDQLDRMLSSDAEA